RRSVDARPFRTDWSVLYYWSMRRRPPPAAARAEAPARPRRPAVIATARRLEDGSLALALTDTDARGLDETLAVVGRLPVQVASGPHPEGGHGELARGLSAVAAGPVSAALASRRVAGAPAAHPARAEPRLALTATLAAAD